MLSAARLSLQEEIGRIGRSQEEIGRIGRAEQDIGRIGRSLIEVCALCCSRCMAGPQQSPCQLVLQCPCAKITAAGCAC